MKKGLTARQTQILKALIDEYIETAEPVGSEALEKKYGFGVSPATIRNEMAQLKRLGYLRQPHTSAGRVPSPDAMKFYIDQLMEEKQMSITDEVKAKEEVWDVRDDVDDLIKEATHALAQRTNALAVSMTDEGKMWHSGYANILMNPEFSDLEITTTLFSLIEEANKMQKIFLETMTGSAPVEIVFGEDLDFLNLKVVSFCGSRFRVGDRNGAIGVVGPARLKYPTVVPVLRYFSNLIQEVAKV